MRMIKVAITYLVDKQVLWRLIGFEDFEGVFRVIGTRIFVANARQIRIAVAHVHLIDTIAGQTGRTNGSRLDGTRFRRARGGAVHGLVSYRFPVWEREKNFHGVIQDILLLLIKTSSQLRTPVCLWRSDWPCPKNASIWFCGRASWNRHYRRRRSWCQLRPSCLYKATGTRCLQNRYRNERRRTNRTALCCWTKTWIPISCLAAAASCPACLTFLKWKRNDYTRKLSYSINWLPLKACRLERTVMERWVEARRISKARTWLTCSKLWPFTSRIWSPRFKPTSSAFEHFSTLATKIPNPRSNPPRMLKWSISSRLGRVSVTVLDLAFAALAKSSILNCQTKREHINSDEEKEEK